MGCDVEGDPKETKAKSISSIASILYFTSSKDKQIVTRIHARRLLIDSISGTKTVDKKKEGVGVPIQCKPRLWCVRYPDAACERYRNEEMARLDEMGTSGGGVLEQGRRKRREFTTVETRLEPAIG